ncbi:MAG TPA: DNA topoisomerase IB [Candidatus Dormibacteraeota bacterium]|nr:DNA topoisomerase IB [Candidatus Dormibacteraeota bacterium]
MDPDAARRSARAAGLRWVDDGIPGIQRERAGAHFRYRAPDGRVIDDSETLQRIAELVIPPAWTDVWISPIANAHLQATGRDARRRKQYRYHPRWREVRDETKYHRMVAFGGALPDIRAHVDRDLSKPGLPRERVLAAVTRLLDVALLRLGNDEYAKQNGSFGLVTLQARHIDVSGSRITFRFKGKSGVAHNVRIHDRRVARVLERTLDLPGERLFEYLDSDGAVRHVDSDDVNEYLREISGEEFSSKDFRTWAGTVLAATALRESGPFSSEREAKRQTVDAIKRVSSQLGNTPAVCRRCYIHPDVLSAHADGSLLKLRLRANGEAEVKNGLREEERAVLRLLRKRLKRAA